MQPIIMRLCCWSDQSHHMTLSEELQVSTSRHQWSKLELLPARNSLTQIVVAASGPGGLNSLNWAELGKLLLGHKLLHWGGELLGGNHGSCDGGGLGSLGPVDHTKSFSGELRLNVNVRLCWNLLVYIRLSRNLHMVIRDNLRGGGGGGSQASEDL